MAGSASLAEGRAAILTGATRRLAAVSDTPRLDAELLLAHALHITREELLLGRANGVPDSRFEALLRRRLDGEPIAYILGYRDFWTITLAVSPAVLIPRPDSETLIAAALDHFGVGGPRRVLDLGTGSGALLLAALDQWPRATGLGIDQSADALVIARQNATRLGLADRAGFALGNWADGIEERFDLLLCNPPYIAEGTALPRDIATFEPSSALYAGTDGLADYRRIAPAIGGLLAPGGMAAIEIGMQQADAVRALFSQSGLAAAVRRDLAGRDRCLVIAA